MIYSVHQVGKHFSPEGVPSGIEALADRVLVVKAIVLLGLQCELGPPFFSVAIWVSEIKIRNVIDKRKSHKAYTLRYNRYG